MVTRQVVIDVPEKVLLAEKTDEISFARELRVLAAVKLYELGRLSSGRAAELADMSRVEFLLELGRYKVFPYEAELRDLERDMADAGFGNRGTGNDGTGIGESEPGRFAR